MFVGSILVCFLWKLLSIGTSRTVVCYNFSFDFLNVFFNWGVVHLYISLVFADITLVCPLGNMERSLLTWWSYFLNVSFIVFLKIWSSFLVCLKYDFKTRTTSSSRNILQRCRGSKIYFILTYHWNSGMPTNDLWMMPLLVSILFIESDNLVMEKDLSVANLIQATDFVPGFLKQSAASFQIIEVVSPCYMSFLICLLVYVEGKNHR